MARAPNCAPLRYARPSHAAHQAFPDWADSSPAYRAKLFFKAAEIVRRRRVEIADILARETGSTIFFATFQQDLVIESLEQAAGWVYNTRGEVFHPTSPDRIPTASDVHWGSSQASHLERSETYYPGARRCCL